MSYVEIPNVDNCRQPEGRAAVFLPAPRRGRPPLDDVERYDSGRKRADRGTAEGRWHKVQLLGRPGAEGDERCSHPLDLMWARGLITETEHTACKRFAKLHRAIGRPPQMRSHLAAVGGGSDADQLIAGCDRYKAALGALEAQGSRAKEVLFGAVLYARPPRFLDTSARRGTDAWLADMRDLDAFRAGAAAIAESLGISEGKHEAKAQTLPESLAAYYEGLLARVRASAKEAETVVRRAAKRSRRAKAR